MSTEQVPFGQNAEFVANPEQRCPCVLLLDTSASMAGEPIKQLNEGIRTFKDELSADAMAAKRAEIAIITFGPVQVVSDFQTADVFQPPVLSATGDTPMGAAIEAALTLIEQRKQAYRSNAIPYLRPWIFLITDGGPTDYWQAAAEKVKADEAGNHVAFFAVGVEGARMDILAQITPRQPLRLKGLRFRDLFLWLASSISGASKSKPGEKVELAPPTGWAAV